ncbi:hypothetical protein V865_004303 [Kwoniella europaea PYCC6329]|uniref:choline-phosphate cytidylyltransferase n=1 Tax=Kwoniella europaea PYCC6329 TaxID=1423913 RepID=A0AAX4KKD7_9TREE
MASTAPLPKRHTRNRLGERRAARDPSSSRDASEEDNDNIENEFSDVGSTISTHAETVSSASTADSPRMQSTTAASPLHVAASGIIAAAGPNATQPLTKRALHQKRVEELSEQGSMSEGLDSPTYDGDIESSSTIGGTPVHPSNLHHHMRGAQPTSPTKGSLGLQSDQPAGSSPYGTNRLPTPKASMANLTLSDSPPSITPQLPYERPTDVPVAPSKALAEPRRSQTLPLSAKPSMSSLGPPKMYTRPIELSEANIKGFVERAIHGKGAEDGVERWWKTNPPPEGKVVRVYADGVYDLFHFGHALQLRQAKLSFPKVHLLVGVCSDDLCASHKSRPAMTHAERCEAVRHCRWVDEILPDAPWVVDQEWLDKYDIDYIAHDEEVYPSKDHEDVYAFAKKNGRFVPTRRTPAISTSDLLERIVRGYRDGFFDSKLEKNGHPELLAADVDWDSSASVEKRERRREQAAHAHKHHQHQHQHNKK